jgi:hypothetical protein
MPQLECIKTEKKNGITKLVFSTSKQIVDPKNTHLSSSQSSSFQSSIHATQSQPRMQITPKYSPLKSLSQSSPKKQVQTTLSFGPSSQIEEGLTIQSPPKLCLRRSYGPLMPMVISGVLTIISLGTIEYERSGYHTYRYIYPIGFKSRKIYTSYINPKTITVYTCEILDGGMYPQFKVSAKDDPKQSFQSESPSGCCLQVVKRIDSAQVEKRSKITVSGPAFFGFAEEKVRDAIYSLPNAKKCANYSHKFIKPPPGSQPRRSYSQKQTKPSDGKQPPRKRMRFLVSGNIGGMVEEGLSDYEDEVALTIVNPSTAKYIEPLNSDNVSCWAEELADIDTIIKTYDYTVQASGLYKQVTQVITTDFSKLERFSAVLLDPPWHKVTPQQRSIFICVDRKKIYW